MHLYPCQIIVPKISITVFRDKNSFIELLVSGTYIHAFSDFLFHFMRTYIGCSETSSAELQEPIACLSWTPTGMGRGWGHLHAPANVAKCFCALVTNTSCRKVSVNEAFVHYFQNMSSASGSGCTQPSNLPTPVKKILRVPMLPIICSVFKLS